MPAPHRYRPLVRPSPWCPGNHQQLDTGQACTLCGRVMVRPSGQSAHPGYQYGATAASYWSKRFRGGG